MKTQTLMLVAALAGCATDSEPDVQPGGGEEAMPIVDEGTVVASYRVLSDFHTDYGADPDITAAVSLLIALDTNPAGTVGEWLVDAAPDREADILAAAASVIDSSPNLAAAHSYDEVTDEDAYRKFHIYQTLEIVETAGLRTLRDTVDGAILWNQYISENGSDSWATAFSMDPIATSGVAYHLDGSQLTIAPHRFSVPLRSIVRAQAPTPLDFEVDISCTTIGQRVADATGLAAQALADACVAGRAKLVTDFNAGIEAIDGHVDFTVSGSATVVGDTLDMGHWEGTQSTAYSGETRIDAGTFKSAY